MNVIEILSQNGIPFERKEHNNVYLECPQCGKSNLSVSVDSGLYHCWSAQCEAGGFRGVFPPPHLKELKGEFTPSEASTPKKTKSLSDDDAKAIQASTQNKAEVIQWAVGRGLEPAFVLAQGVGYDKNLKAIVIPYRDAKGVLIGAKYRGTDRPDQWIKGVTPELFILDPSDLQKEKVVIVEGETDALALKQLKIPVVAVLGASKTQGLHLLASVRQVYLGYDMDEAGAIGAEKAAQELGRYRCKRIEWRLPGDENGFKDPNDMLKALSGKEVIECVKSAKTLATDIKSKSAAAALKEYLSNLENTPKKRLSWGYPRLDAFTNGIGGGEFIGVLAEAGTGKTTFVINSARNLAYAGVTVGIASLEEHNVNEITPKLCATIIGRNPGAGGFSSAEVAQMQAELGRVQLYDGEEEFEPIVDWIKECYFVHDVKVVFIDYLQWLIDDETNVQRVKDICKGFKKLTKEFSELCIVMIVQPKQKQRARQKDGSEAAPMKLEGADARGGSTINQSVDKMLTIKGLPNHPNITQFEYTKVRGHLNVSKREWLNKFTQLEYDHNTLRQLEVQQLIYGGV